MSNSLSPSGPRSRALFFTALGLAFLFRLAFGLCSEIWFIDQRQVYLIGLKFYCTGLWPFFGADVAPHIQLPGALQGLVVGLPLHLLPILESPYIILNLLSFAGLTLFAWYCSQRLPQFPKWLLYTWLLTAPWALAWSTNIDNDSYVIFGSCLFFIGFLETMPAFSLGLVRPAWADFLMGFGLFWDAQFHMSYVVLIPFLLVSVYFQWKSKVGGLVLNLVSLLAGCFTTGLFILPTLLKYGWSQGTGGAGHAVAFNPGNFLSLFTVLARFLSLASCEIPRFIGAHTADRLEFLRENWWLWPFAAVAGILGILQALALLAGWFQKNHPQKDWPAVKALALGTFLLIYISFLFAIKAPAAHTYYLTLPLAMLYGFYVYFPWVSKKWFLNLAKALVVCNILFQTGLAAHNFKAKSLYKDRALFVNAIRQKNYHLLGDRRPDTLY